MRYVKMHEVRDPKLRDSVRNNERRIIIRISLLIAENSIKIKIAPVLGHNVV